MEITSDGEKLRPPPPIPRRILRTLRDNPPHPPGLINSGFPFFHLFKNICFFPVGFKRRNRSLLEILFICSRGLSKWKIWLTRTEHVIIYVCDMYLYMHVYVYDFSANGSLGICFPGTEGRGVCGAVSLQRGPPEARAGGPTCASVF